jgi:hypothetical protein
MSIDLLWASSLVPASLRRSLAGSPRDLTLPKKRFFSSVFASAIDEPLESEGLDRPKSNSRERDRFVLSGKGGVSVDCLDGGSCVGAVVMMAGAASRVSSPSAAEGANALGGTAGTGGTSWSSMRARAASCVSLDTRRNRSRESRDADAGRASDVDGRGDSGT